MKNLKKPTKYSDINVEFYGVEVNPINGMQYPGYNQYKPPQQPTCGGGNSNNGGSGSGGTPFEDILNDFRNKNKKNK